MKATVSIRATPPLRRAYRELVSADWDDTTLPRTLDLLELLLATGGVGLAPAQTGQRRASKPHPLPDDAPARLRDFMERLSDGTLPAVPEPPADGAGAEGSELAQLARRARLLLCVQAFFCFQGDAGLLRDAQAVAFHALLDVVLPKLKDAKLGDEHALTLNALAAHLAVEWRDEPAQRCVLQAALLSHVGQRDAAARHLMHAYRSTSPDAREYLGLVLANCSNLVERGLAQDAELFLLDAYRCAPPESLGEVRDILAAVRHVR